MAVHRIAREGDTIFIDRAQFGLGVLTASVVGSSVGIVSGSTTVLKALPTELFDSTKTNFAFDAAGTVTALNTLFGAAATAVQSVSATAPLSNSGTASDVTLQIARATTSADGSMSSTDKSKLNGIAAGAEVNPADTDALSEGSTNLYYTDARVSANSDVATNSAKVSYTDAAAVALNSAKTSFPGFGTTAGTALQGNTAVALSVNSETPDFSGDISLSLANVTQGGGAFGGDVDTSGNELKSPRTANLKLNAQGTQVVEILGNQGSSGTDDNAGAIKLNCAANLHGIIIKSPPHSAGADYTLVLPTSDGSADEVLKTDGNGNLSWAAQTGGTGGGGMTETPLCTIAGRATFSSADDDESVMLGGSYGVNFYSHTSEIGDYDSSAVIDTTTRSDNAYRQSYSGIHLPSDSKKVRAKIHYRIQNAANGQTWGFSMWSSDYVTGTGQVSMTLRGRSTDTSIASSSSVYMYNKEFTTTSALTNDLIYFAIDHRGGSINTTTYVYFTVQLFLVD